MSLVTDGHLVSVTLYFEEVLDGSSRSGKARVKKGHESKSDYVNFDNISRCDAIHKFLSFHEIQDKYEPSPIQGPQFKMWYTGSRYV
jgi:hypothetical protein